MSTLRDKQRTRRTLIMAAIAGVLSLAAILTHLGGSAAMRGGLPVGVLPSAVHGGKRRPLRASCPSLR